MIQTTEHTYLYMVYQQLPEEVSQYTTVYFLRNTPGMVTLPNTMDEAHEILPALFEIGVLNGHTLIMLEQMITQVNESYECIINILMISKSICIS